ncbi:hypothetical protein A3Q56_02675 [Intoshia linei]|uniref:Homeobox domain-containing protein n=1 Tax=Intoshia linei TaxID=1819745 RepID=A0A177B5M3_9BILA|nr:hypothetical protein A3Q56_02675 [Intoshia linei]
MNLSDESLPHNLPLDLSFKNKNEKMDNEQDSTIFRPWNGMNKIDLSSNIRVAHHYVMSDMEREMSCKVESVETMTDSGYVENSIIAHGSNKKCGKNEFVTATDLSGCTTSTKPLFCRENKEVWSNFYNSKSNCISHPKNERLNSWKGKQDENLISPNEATNQLINGFLKYALTKSNLIHTNTYPDVSSSKLKIDSALNYSNLRNDSTNCTKLQKKIKPRQNDCYDEKVLSNIVKNLKNPMDSKMNCLNKIKSEKNNLENVNMEIKSKTRERILFTHEVTKILKNWYAAHNDHPYPGLNQIHFLSDSTMLSSKQIKKWFANRRHRSKYNSTDLYPNITKSL